MLKKRQIMMALLIIFISLWGNKPAEAKTAAPYSITNYKSNVTLYPDGSAYFDEHITYRLLQEKVRIEKPIPMSNASGVEEMKVFRQEQKDSADKSKATDLISLKQSAESGKNSRDVYRYFPADKKEEVYQIAVPFHGKKREEVTLVYRYKLKDTVYLYKDTAAFLWQFILPEQKVEIRNLSVRITLPEKIAKDQMDGYVSGSAYAEKEEPGNGIFRVTAGKINPEEALEVALLLPNSLFPDGRKAIDDNAKATIVSNMAKWEDEAARARQKEDLMFYSGWAIAVLSVLLSCGTGLLLYWRDRRKPGKLKKDKAKGLPNAPYTPAELGILLHQGKIGIREFTATVLHLIQTGYLELHFDEKKEGSLIRKEKTEETKLRPQEQYVLHWFVTEMGNGKELSLKALNGILDDYSSVHRQATSEWESMVDKEAVEWKFEESKKKDKAWGLGAAAIGLLSAGVAAFPLKNPRAGILSVLFALALAGTVLSLKKTSKSGMFQIAQWQQFKDFLRSQLSGDSTRLPLGIWEQYLVYAVPLGMAKEVLEKLPDSYPPSSFEDGNLTILHADSRSWLLNIPSGLE